MKIQWNSIRLLTVLLLLFAGRESQGASRWDKPTADLAGRVAEILGPGQAQITVANRSTIATAEIPAIRRMLEDELRSHGVQPAGNESANQIHITLSETARQWLWVAEVVEGSQSRFAMVSFRREIDASETSRAAILLTRKLVWSAAEPVDAPILGALEMSPNLVLLERNSLAIKTRTATGWQEIKRLELGRRTADSRDPRGLIIPASDGFTAYAAGVQCDGKLAAMSDAVASGWTIQCHASDDPWPVSASNLTSGSAGLRAFFNPARNFYTGVLSPSPSLALPPFFSMAVLAGPRLIVGGIDGNVQLLEGESREPVAGTRDWGSDFTAVRTGCGSGTQILATSSGEAESDSLRAYEIEAREAVAVSAPLEVGGAITALWTAPDGASALAAIRKSPTEYEVVRVAALCP